MLNNSQFDNLAEKDILKALGEEVPPDLDDILGDSKTTNFEGLDNLIGSIDEVEPETVEDEIVDVNDLDILPMDEIESAIQNQDKETDLTIDTKTVSYLLNELLNNNKTVEITIKVKE